MKRLAIATLAAAMLTVPTISQAAPVINAPLSNSGIVQVDWKPIKKKVVVKRKPNGTVTRKVVRKYGDHRVVTVKKWRNGQKYASWRGHSAHSRSGWSMRDANRPASGPVPAK